MWQSLKIWGGRKYSNAACRRCPAAPFDLPKSGRAAAPPAAPWARANKNVKKPPGKKGQTFRK